jgi:hypothetical protein
VTSYGDHFPLFTGIGKKVRGMRTSRRLRVTTSKHRSQVHPHEDTLPMSVENMRVLVDYGIAGVAVGMAV